MDSNKILTFDLPTIFEKPTQPSGGRKKFPHIVLNSL